MSRPDSPRLAATARASIAATAARLMAEDGITDFHLAKRKAARQLGLPAHTAFPDNAEVEQELRAYRSLYQDEEHAELLHGLRETALELMELLADYRPYLTGSVLDGTAGPHSNIDLLLFADSAKDVEIFLLNHGIDYEHVEPRNDRAEAVLVVETEDADANLVIFPPQLERTSFKTRDGRPRERARAEAVAALLEPVAER